MRKQPLPGPGDALLVVDVQKDFLPGGSLAVKDGDRVIPPLNRVITFFERKRLPIFATRNWHSKDHCSFVQQGGQWPPHCISETPGAEFGAGLHLPAGTRIVSKAMSPERDAYSGFQETALNDDLRALGISRVIIGGLTAEYCVLTTARDATRLGYDVVVLEDAIRPVNVHPRDGERALEEMRRMGVQLVSTASFMAESEPRERAA